MYINDEDKALFNEVLENKDRYKVMVDNDCIMVVNKEDFEKYDNDEIEDYETKSFREYGYDLLAELFYYLGVDVDYV